MDRKHGHHKGHHLRAGPIMRNPYLNFLRDFRKKHTGLSAVDIVRRGAEAWNNLCKEERTKYIVEAFYARPAKRLRRSKSCYKSKVKHSRSSSVRHSHSLSRHRPRVTFSAGCSRPSKSSTRHHHMC